jgi:hypothetical protein
MAQVASLLASSSLRSSSSGTSSSISGKSCRSSSRMCASSSSPATSHVSRSTLPAATAMSSLRASPSRRRGWSVRSARRGRAAARRPRGGSSSRRQRPPRPRDPRAASTSATRPRSSSVPCARRADPARGHLEDRVGCAKSDRTSKLLIFCRWDRVFGTPQAEEPPPSTRSRHRTTKNKSTGRSYGPLAACANQSFRALHPAEGLSTCRPSYRAPYFYGYCTVRLYVASGLKLLPSGNTSFARK